MGNASDDDQALIIVDRVDNPVVADSNPIVVAAGELDGSRGPGVAGEAVDGSGDTAAEEVVEPPIGAGGLGVQANFVGALRRRGYVRTSSQGKAELRSSRAWRAARLSSRSSRRSISSA